MLEVVSPTQIIVDLNQNGIKDDEEEFSINGIESFSTKLNPEQSKLAEKLKISEEDALGLGFLAENFAKEKLLEKRIRLKTDKNNFKIIVDDKDYADLLVNSGFALGKDNKKTVEFEKNIEKVKKLNLKIFNEKSHKYHKLNCKYGLMAHNSEILPKNQLPKDAKPCNFCLVHSNKKQKTKNKVGQDFIPNIPQAPVELDLANVKIFLTDLTTVLKPSNNCNTALCRALIKEIDSAQNSIDFAIYGYSKIPQFQQSIENAQKRGVKIRFVYDTDAQGENIYPDTLYLSKVLANNKSDCEPALMHNKFFVFDGRKVLMGSANMSNTDLSGFNSNAVLLINSEKIANLYEQEFEQMYGGKFHAQKLKISEKEHIKVDDLDFSIYFSPKDDAINSRIIPLVNGAQKYIYMPVFLITHKGLTQSLINSSNRGVNVKIILDATNSHGNYSSHKLLRQSGIQVKTENFAGKCHSKSIIIDDRYTVIGSMNFSRSGVGKNDENLIIIDNQEIAMFYKTFFQYLWQKIPDKWLKLNARAESPDSIGSCQDGIDNDFDGKIDKSDESCRAK